MHKPIPFLDLRVTDATERQELLDAMNIVLQHGRLILGPEVQALEQRMAAQCGRQYGVGVNSGTDAVFLGLKSLGLGPGDEVITTSFSWIATANAIALTGATPVFADIRDDLNIDPASVARLITPRTRVILPVHYTGKVCRMPAILEIAAAHNLLIVEDAAQAFAARYAGQPAGAFGTIACFSMNPTKVLGACGDAGMILTDRRDLYERLVSLRYNGTLNRELCVEASLNARLDTLQAAVLLKRLDRIEALIQTRRSLAAHYSDLLNGIVALPTETPDERDIYYIYTIRTPHRDALMAFLTERGVETKIRHPYLMPEQPAYRHNNRGEYVNAQRLIKQILCLPIHEKLSVADVEYVADCVREFMRTAGE